jgi:hypothetical protein
MRGVYISVLVLKRFRFELLLHCVMCEACAPCHAHDTCKCMRERSMTAQLIIGNVRAPCDMRPFARRRARAVPCVSAYTA